MTHVHRPQWLSSRDIARDKRETAAEHRALSATTDDPNVRRRHEVEASRLEDSAQLHDALAHMYERRASALAESAPLMRWPRPRLTRPAVRRRVA
jgi:hypothetical protein